MQLPVLAFHTNASSLTVIENEVGYVDVFRSQESIKKYCSKAELLVTLKEHNTLAGFGSKISRVVGEIYPCALLIIRIDDLLG